MLCQRPTFDPDKRERPWSRGVSDGRLVLICPNCQKDRPDWMDRLDRCDRCGGTRLSVTMGEVVCRQCGLVAGTRPTGDVL
jgi:predicted amidophosphoribosyltransferase